MGILDSFQRGLQFSRDSARQRREDERLALERSRQDAAFEALEQDFGPIAGDPTRAGQLAGIQQRQTAFDNAQQDRGTDQFLQAAQRTGNLFRQARARGADTETALGVIDPILPRLAGGNQQAAQEVRQLIAQNPDAADDFLLALNGAEGSGIRAVAGPTAVRLSSGEEVIATPVETPNGARLQLPDGQFIDDPGAQLVDSQLRRVRALTQRRNAAAREFGQEVGRPQPGEELAVDRTAPSGQRVLGIRTVPGGEAEREIAAGQRERVQGLQNLERQATLALRDANTALNLIDQTASFQGNDALSTGRRIAASRIPSTDEFEVERSIQAFKDNVGIDQLLNIKREGSGLGHVPQAQLETLQSLLGRLEVGRNPDILRRDLRDAVTIYENVLSGPTEELEALGVSTLGIDTSGRISGGGAGRSQPARSGAGDVDFVFNPETGQLDPVGG